MLELWPSIGDVSNTEGGSFMVKVLGDLSLAGLWPRVCFWAILVKERSNFSNSRTETQNFVILVYVRRKFDKFCLENTNS